MTIREKIAREYIRRWLPDFHLSYNPGKHPETRKALNGATSKVLDKYTLKGPKDFDSPEEYQEYMEKYEDYCEMKREEARENADIRDDWQIGRGSCKGTGGNPRRDKRSGKPLL